MQMLVTMRLWGNWQDFQRENLSDLEATSCSLFWAAEQGKHLLHVCNTIVSNMQNPSCQLHAGPGALQDLLSVKELYDVHIASSNDKGSPPLWEDYQAFVGPGEWFP
jgi:hypothetical protein